MSLCRSLLPKVCWEKNRLIFLHSIAFGLILSWFIPITHSIWVYIDTQAFYFFNSLITDSRYIQLFWAFCNTSKNDWAFDVIMLIFFASYISGNNRVEVKERSIKVVTAILLMLVVCGLNRLFFHRILIIERLSPSLVLEMTQRLSQLVPSLHVKESASTCYPGDHGITAFSFILVSYFTMSRTRTFIAALVTIPLLIMPRLVAGAHWLSDVILGSFLLAMVPAIWLFYSPIFGLITHQFCNIIEGRKSSHAQEKNSRPHRPSST